MPRILFYDDPAQPQSDAFQALGEALAQGGPSGPLRDPVESVNSLDALGQALVADPQAALIFTSPLSSAEAFARQVCALSPSVACVALTPASEADASPVFSDWVDRRTDYLLTPFTPFDACARVAAALRLSAALAVNADQVDAATGLYHQRPFMARLQEELSLARRHLSPFACLAIGIDGFAMYRDSYGYDTSQAMLARVADVIRQRKRQEDIAALVGDGEIAMLLPRSSEKGCSPLIVRILQSLAATPFRAPSPDGAGAAPVEEILDLHVGVAAYPALDEGRDSQDDGHDAMTADILLRYARHALHQARRRDGERPADRIVRFSEIRPTLG